MEVVRREVTHTFTAIQQLLYTLFVQDHHYPRAKMPSTSGNKWISRKVLGSGSFGDVILYQLGDTPEFIALKKCKNVLQNGNLKRWCDEVKFMRELKHSNIVQGLQVPPELEARPPEPPCLAMEFCSRGDLRKKLSELPNMCGLPEAEILLLAKHIASAMEYLHKADIIHRDIKPENIMVQDFQGKNMYKLTDLGFAKDSKQQPATSFVGTKEYMAPELYSQTQYTKTADYWSFGTVLSEVITGNRPFMLSVLPVVRWHEIIAKKQKEDIGYYEDCNGHLNYAKNLPDPHQLCGPVRESLEKLLIMLLCQDPETRGKPLKDGRPIFYQWLEFLIVCKIIHVRCMMDGRLISFPTRDNDAVVDLHKTLSSVTGLPTEQHIILLANGDRLTDDSAILHDIFKTRCSDRTVYLYPRDIPVTNHNFYIPQRTQMVDAMMNNKHLNVSENGFKVMWKQSIHCCHHLMKDAAARSTGFIAFLNYSLKLRAQLTQCAGELRKTLHMLQAKAQFFLDSMNTDTQQYARQVASGFSSVAVYDSWKKMAEEVGTVAETPEREVDGIERKIGEAQQFLYETQKNSEKLKTVDGLQETTKGCDASFRKFKEENKVKRREHMDLMPIQSQIDQAYGQFREYNQKLFAQIREVQKSCQMMNGIMAGIRDCMQMMEDSQNQILQLQKDKQKTMWDVLNVAIQKKKESEAQLQRQLSRSKSLIGVTTPPSSSSSGGAAPIFEAPAEPEVAPSNPVPDSIMDESMLMQSEFNEMMNSIVLEQTQFTEELNSLDWGHLRDT